MSNEEHPLCGCRKSKGECEELFMQLIVGSSNSVVSIVSKFDLNDLFIRSCAGGLLVTRVFLYCNKTR